LYTNYGDFRITLYATWHRDTQFKDDISDNAIHSNIAVLIRNLF
jgi:hypothetical protein